VLDILYALEIVNIRQANNSASITIELCLLEYTIAFTTL
jgi:hypothetical protein